MRVDPATGIEGAVVYIVDEGDVTVVTEMWRNAFEKAPPFAAVLVNGLPRGARVEWHIIRCQKPTEEDAPPRLRMAFAEHEIVTAINEVRRDNGVLCISLGSDKFATQIQSRYPNVAVQTVPSTAIYSDSKSKVARHDTCVIILSE